MAEIFFRINQYRIGMVESGLGVDETSFARNFSVSKMSIIKRKKEYMGKNCIYGIEVCSV